MHTLQTWFILFFDQGSVIITKLISDKKILSVIQDKPYFVKDNFVLYLGDSLRILSQLSENSIDMIFADPHSTDPRLVDRITNTDYLVKW